jgi:hypothetical protein
VWFVAKLGDVFKVAGVGGILAALAAGRFTLAPATSPAAPPSGSAKPAAPSSHLPGQTAESLLVRYYGGALADPNQPLPRRNDSLQAIIALVPDPIDSHLDYKFDAYVESFRRAFGAAGFSPDRFWLPWVHEDTSGDQGPTFRGNFPGIMLFRNGARLAVLYLVGESPTAGIHTKAFDAAVAGVVRLSQPNRSFTFDWGPGTPRGVLRIAGPTFSGSAPSLRRALDRIWAGKQGLVGARVISGSATAPATKTTLDDRTCLHPSTNPLSATHCDLFRTTFSATVRPDRILTRVIADSALARIGIRPCDVAVIREGNTQYGRPPGTTGTAPAPAASDTTCRDNMPVEIFVPSNLGALRGVSANDLASSELQVGSQIPKVALNLRDVSGFTENPPSFSPLTPAAMDVLLEEIYLTLREHHIRAVGLQFTDDRDKVFFAKELHQHVPDIMLLSYGGNALFLRPDVNPALLGSLIVTSYPLNLETLWWRSAIRKEHLTLLPFLFEGAEGGYNALLRQLDYRRGLDSLMRDYTVPKRWLLDSVAPPVWLMEVGRDRFVPLNVFTYHDTSGYTEPMAMPVANPDSNWFHPVQPGQPTWVFLAVVAGGLLFGLGMFDRRRAREAQKRFIQSGVVGESGRSAFGPQRARYQLASAAVGLAVGYPAAIVVLAGVLPSHELFAWWIFVGLALGVLTVMSVRVVRALARRHWTPPTVDGRPEWCARWNGESILTALVACVFLAAVLWVLRGMAPNATRLEGFPLLEAFRAHLWLARALSFRTGLSPLAPLAWSGLVLAVWTWWQLRRTALLTETTPLEAAILTGAHKLRVRPGRFLRSPAAEAITSMHEVRWRLSERPPRLGWSDQLLWAFLILAALLPVLLETTHTWEGVGGAGIVADSGFWKALRLTNGVASPFDAALRVGLLVVFVAVACLAYRLVRVWQSLRGCLRALARTPLITAFERLPQRVSRLTRVSLWSPSADFIDSVATTQWIHLRALYTQNSKDFGEWAQSHPALGARVSDLMEEGPVRPTPKLGVFVRRVWRVLEAYWLSEPGEEDLKRLAQIPPPSAGKDPPYRSVTGAFRRTFEGVERVWLRELEEFVCVQIVAYLEWASTQLRAMAKALLISMVLMILFIGSYPFRPESGIKLTALVVLTGAVASLVMVMLQANSDDVLSRIAKTDPGRMTWDASFILNLAVVGGLPLLALLATEFPTVRDFMFGWVQPIARLIGGARG